MRFFHSKTPIERFPFAAQVNRRTMRRQGAFAVSIAVAVIAVALFSQSAISSNAATGVTQVDFAQCANGTAHATSCTQGWINGILNQNNSSFYEDQVTAQRLEVSVPKGSTLQHSVTIKYQTRKGSGSNHAYDSLATWNYTLSTAVRCQGLLPADCVAGSPVTGAIPADPTALAPFGTSISAMDATSNHQLTGQVITAFGAASIDSVSVPVHDCTAGADCGTASVDDYATVTITFSLADTSADHEVQLLFGGHLAASQGPRGWGTGFGSAFISGGPYHFKWTAVDSASIGNRDNQIIGASILAQPTITTTPNPSSGTAPVTLNDSAVLAGAVTGAGGTITFKLFPPSDSTCSGTPVFSPTPTAVSGSGTYTTSSGYSATTAGTYHWTASYSGDSNDAPAASVCADEPVTVSQALTVSTSLTTKSVTAAPILVGDTVTVVVTETNTGTAALTGVNVTGGGSCASFTGGATTLAAGASTDFTCTFTAVAGTNSWSALGHGTDPNGNPAPSTGESQSGSVTGLTVSTSLTTKSVTAAPILVGNTVTVVVTETNTGTAALTGVSVTGGGSCASFTGGATTLAAGASTDFTCTFTAVAGTNSWSALGHGTDPDGHAAPSTGESQSGSVTGLTVSTSLALKSAGPDPAVVGQTVTIVVTETNTGTAALTGVSVTGGGSCTSFTGGATTLAAGASTDFTCTFTAIAGTNSWSALGHGTDPNGQPAPATGESQSGSITGLTVSTSLSLKSVTPGTTVEPGTSVTVTVTETNTGTDTLSNVTVTGTPCATYSPPSVASLAAGASQDFSCTFTANSTTNWSADGRGTDSVGATAPATGEHQEGTITVIGPGTTLTTVSVTPGTTVEAGTPVTITVNEKNTGDSTITDVSVTGTGCTTYSPASVASLAAGASQDFTCTFTANSNTSWTAAGQGTDSLDNPVSTEGETQSGTVTVISAATTLTTKSVSPSTSVAAGTSVTITVTEKNTGNSAIFNVSVTGTGCSTYSPAGVANLAPNATADFTCTFTANSTTSWTATGHGIDSLENQVPSTGETTSGTVTVTPPPPPPPPPPFFPPTGTVTVIKHVVNAFGGTMTAANFNVHLKNSSGMDVNGSPQAGSETGTAYVLGTGTYTVSEDSPPSGYLQTSITCDGTATATITVASAGDTHTCTITNSDQPGSLTVIKHVVNLTGHAKASDFTMTVSGGTPSPASFAGSETGTVVTLKAGTYAVSETNLPGYAATLSAGCTGTIANGQAKTCTVTNTQLAAPVGTVTVIKHVINTAGGTKTAADFTVHVKLNGTDVTGSPQAGSETGTAYTLNPGTYTVSEDAVPTGYQQVSITCDGVATATFTIASAGDTHTCTITNQALPTPPAPPNTGNSGPGATMHTGWWVLLALLGSLALIGTGTAVVLQHTRRA